MAIVKVEALFTPAEVARITGVSPELQRDWRRRGLLKPSNEGKHVRFTAYELGYLKALKAFSEAGVLVGEADLAAAASSFPTWHFASEIVLRRISYKGLPDYVSPGNEAKRFVLSTQRGVYTMGDINDMVRFVDGEDTSALVTMIYDCRKAAEEIVKQAPRPLIALDNDERQVIHAR